MAKLKAKSDNRSDKQEKPDKHEKPVEKQEQKHEQSDRETVTVQPSDVGVLSMPETKEQQGGVALDNDPLAQEVHQPDGHAGQHVEQPQPPAVSQARPAVPFSVEMPGQAASAGGGSRGNLVQRRQDQIATALLNKTFEFKELRSGQQFFCICGAEGKNAIVLKATDTVTGETSEVLVGSSCLKHTGVTVPKQPRAKGSLAPGISKQQKFGEALSKYVAPFRFVRKQDGPFACLCGGRGVNQIVIADANGTEFSVGNTCAEIIPGVVVPKQQREARKGMPAVAGLKGGVQAPPTFQNVG